jgi:asparagine synthase (glutamine-hydrolysing)
MCGICGAVFANDNGCGPAFVAACSTDLAARGPDGAGESTARIGVWTVRLGHRRLSVVDPTAGGHQPMLRGQGLVLNYNGEVYNHV